MMLRRILSKSAKSINFLKSRTLFFNQSLRTTIRNNFSEATEEISDPIGTPKIFVLNKYLLHYQPPAFLNIFVPNLRFPKKSTQTNKKNREKTRLNKSSKPRPKNSSTSSQTPFTRTKMSSSENSCQMLPTPSKSDDMKA